MSQAFRLLIAFTVTISLSLWQSIYTSISGYTSLYLNIHLMRASFCISFESHLDVLFIRSYWYWGEIRQEGKTFMRTDWPAKEIWLDQNSSLLGIGKKNRRLTGTISQPNFHLPSVAPFCNFSSSFWSRPCVTLIARKLCSCFPIDGLIHTGHMVSIFVGGNTWLIVEHS